ncbi:MAG: hypothetical protein Q4G19_05635 [Clostridia bacterium]|nr:hypothetical protein [Clostridia bacterium]
MTDTGKTRRKRLRRILKILLVAVLCIVSMIIGAFWKVFQEENPYPDHTAKSAYAFSKTNLSPSFEVNYVLDGRHTGRDSFIQTIFEVPYSANREELMELIRNADGWHAETITADDYRSFAEVTWYPSIVKNTVSDDIEFDAWFYCVTAPSAGYEPDIGGHFSFLGQAARGFEFAVFDQDTGLFIYIDQLG